MIDIAYKKSGINLKYAVAEAANVNPDAYNYTTDNAENDDFLLRRVQNWHSFLKDKGLLNKLDNPDEPDNYIKNKPYQAGDVLFIEHKKSYTNEDGKTEYYWDLDHSAIITKVDASTGLPLEVVSASWRGEKGVKKFSWENWQEYLEDNNGRINSYGGFREGESPPINLTEEI